VTVLVCQSLDGCNEVDNLLMEPGSQSMFWGLSSLGSQVSFYKVWVMGFFAVCALYKQSENERISATLLLYTYQIL
jgi:hypothetical protein